MPGILKVGDRVIAFQDMVGTVCYIHPVGVHVWVQWDKFPGVHTGERTNVLTASLEFAPVLPDFTNPQEVEQWLTQ